MHLILLLLFCFFVYFFVVSTSTLKFFSGWWFLIDAISVHPGQITALHIILGIMGTISLIMVNSVTQAQVYNNIHSSDQQFDKEKSKNLCLLYAIYLDKWRCCIQWWLHGSQRCPHLDIRRLRAWFCCNHCSCLDHDSIFQCRA